MVLQEVSKVFLGNTPGIAEAGLDLGPALSDGWLINFSRATFTVILKSKVLTVQEKFFLLQLRMHYVVTALSACQWNAGCKPKPDQKNKQQNRLRSSDGSLILLFYISGELGPSPGTSTTKGGTSRKSYEELLCSSLPNYPSITSSPTQTFNR